MIRVIDIETTGHRSRPRRDHRDRQRRHGAGRRHHQRHGHAGAPGKPIPPGASAIHHIIDEDVKNAPPFARSSNASGAPTIYVAHNCEFEHSFFAAQGIELGPWICTYKCALRVWPELDGHSNQELRYALGRATPFPALSAAPSPRIAPRSTWCVTAAIFEELIKRARWSELMQWSGEPALHTALSFRQVSRSALRRDRRKRSGLLAVDRREVRARGRHQAQRKILASHSVLSPQPAHNIRPQPPPAPEFRLCEDCPATLGLEPGVS